MTEGLDAMVKAMHAEFLRQIGLTEPGHSAKGYVGDLENSSDDGVCLDGHFDLEKVARAGLLAIREPTDDESAATPKDDGAL